MQKLIHRILDEIPHYDRFLSTAEMDESSVQLSKKYPELVDLFEIGVSASGRPLNCLKIGSGKKTILFMGCPHPNEPIGAMLTEYLTEKVASDKELREAFDYTWYFVKSWDIDGTALNEGWFRGPFTVRNYARNFYRPAPLQQVEWTFPIDYKNYHFDKMMSETEAIKNLIDKIKPDLVYSLHNAGFGGAYWYITRDEPELYPKFYELAESRGIPLQLGEPEAPYGVLYSDAVFNMIDTADEYDYLEKYSDDPPEEKLSAGGSSAYYAGKVSGAQTIVTELPYFYDDRICDMSETEFIRSDLVIEFMEFSKEKDKYVQSLLSKVKDYIDPECRFYKALDAFSSFANQDAMIKMAKEDPDYARKATVAEVFDNKIIRKFYILLQYGMLIRMHENALGKLGDNDYNSHAKKVLEEGLEESVKKFDELEAWLENSLNYKVIPIRDLIAIQLGTGLYLAEKIQNE